MPDFGKRAALLAGTLVLLVMLLCLTSCAAGTDDTGVMKYAYSSNPRTLDVHKSTETGSGIVAGYITEYLFSLDSGFVPKPVLAESHLAGEDGLHHTIKLREGVLFHNGKEMTAGDVVASVERWLTTRPTTPKLAGLLESVEASDKYSVVFRLVKPHADFLYMISSGSNLVIYPEELVKEYGDDYIPDEKIVGTGPFKFRAKDHTRYIQLERFEGYDEGPAGTTGRIPALFDKMFFYVLPSSETRLMGVESGEYHVAVGVDFTEYQRINDHPKMRPLVTFPAASLIIEINCALKLTSDVRVRQAVQAAIDVEPILLTSFPPALYEISPGYMPGETDWYSEAGSGYYNQGDTSKAKQLLEDAGYNGEPVVLLGMTGVTMFRNSAMIIVDQLEEAGFNIDLQLLEPIQFLERSKSAEGWHLMLTAEPVRGTPALLGWTGGEPSGSWRGETRRTLELGKLLQAEADHGRRFEIWEELQGLFYTEAFRVRIGTFGYVSAISSKVYDP